MLKLQWCYLSRQRRVKFEFEFRLLFQFGVPVPVALSRILSSLPFVFVPLSRPTPSRSHKTSSNHHLNPRNRVGPPSTLSRSTPEPAQRIMEGEGEKNKGESLPLQIDPNRYVQHAMFFWSLNPDDGIPNAFRVIHQSTENDKVRLDFYTIYEKEASRYDRDLVNKCNEELSTTLIFVRSLDFLNVPLFTFAPRPVCSPPSVQPSSSRSTRSSNQIRTRCQQCSFSRFSSPLIQPPTLLKTPLIYLPRKGFPI